ncbi:hypothetical protein [Bacillus glycinifermentans]|uniref:Uncharacterized protein n=1 Tax=Bacillus glycinifermentans TaxID=1664069 RepID=A0ABU6H5Q9_9BACI|nr:hypothetical protein [Bacillus glycinifermentans]MEC0485331.1 hypothetical protein [Bacillus glycinifermentans]MEC0495483.1 hypothetical protein [Bacillus glycinifermentans]MEC0540284.1 hypothetical protein [Bacillus glycinifermentans]UOY88958.1 hypothetical protein MW696_01480 [Bacillus glycinifermentans]
MKKTVASFEGAAFLILYKNSKIEPFLFFINPIKKVGLTFIRIVLKFKNTKANLSRAVEGLVR